MKKICCLFLALLLLLSCTACTDWDELAEDPLRELSSYYQSENESQEASELTSFSLPYCDTETLDAVTCSDGFQQVVGKLLYESLYELDESFEPQGVLAESCRYDVASLTYTIKIRSGVCFSDGSPLTATDVTDTLHRAAQSARYGSRFTKVGWISADRDKVIITMLEPNGGLLSLLDIPIVKSGTETQKTPLGTGPYAVAKGENGGNYLAPTPIGGRTGVCRWIVSTWSPARPLMPPTMPLPPRTFNCCVPIWWGQMPPLPMSAVPVPTPPAR